MGSSHRIVLGLALPIVVALGSCATEQGARPRVVGGPSVAREVARPAGCTTVRAGRALQVAIDAAPEGAALCLAAGDHWGPIRVTRRVTLWGPRDARVRSRGVGTTVEVKADGSRLLGFTIDGSGTHYDTSDAAVRVHADDVRIEGLTIVHAIFGILVEQSNRVLVAGNDYTGDASVPTGLRGDGIRLWETRQSRVEGNHVRWARDCVMWYSSGNVFVGNTVEHGRYGAHLMYSHGNRLERNRFLHNVVGTFLMYSRNIEIVDSDYVDMSTPAAMGIGLKESGSVDIRRNRFVHCTVALYLDTTPLSRGEIDHIDRNQFVLCEKAIVFHGRAEGNTFRDNVLRDNREEVDVEGGGDALASIWSGNHFDDYEGYDFDGDGRGDVAYEERSLASQLTSAHPNLAFFRGTPAMGVVEAMGKLVPLFAPRTIIRDSSPRIDAPSAEGMR